MIFKSIDLLCDLEGFKASPYLDSKGIPTIGIGSCYYPNGRKVTLKDPAITKNQAIEYAKTYINELEKWLSSNLRYKANSNQWDATICFLYNTGLGHFDGTNAVQWVATKQAILTGINWVDAVKSIRNNGLLDSRRVKECKLYQKGV